MKKIISILLVTVMLMSMTAFVTSAAEAPAVTGYKEHTITFDASTTDWQNYKNIYCHIWVHGGDPIFAFKSKSEKCTDNGDGTWTYDLDAKGVTLEEGVLYSVLFGNENGMQTYNLLLDTSCYGDTAYCDGTRYENPVDSNKTALAAYWSDISPSILGPELCITSIGNVVGSCIPYTTSAFDLFVTFLSPEGNFANARFTSGKTDQEIIDDTARALGLDADQIKEAIVYVGIDVNWSASGDVDEPYYPDYEPDYPYYPDYEEPDYDEPAPWPYEPSNTLTFDASTTDWRNFKTIYCHIWEYDGDAFYAYGAKKEKCNDNGDGTWTYDLDAKGVTLEEGVLYSVLFANENGMMTYDLLFDKSVLGDTAYCDGTVYENPVDSNKKHPAAYWRGQYRSKFGPEKCITSIGNVVGTCIPYTTSAYDMFSDFLENYLDNARIFTGKTDQEIIDDIAKALGLSDLEVSDAIHWSGVYVNWSPKAGKGDVDGDNVVSVMDATAIQRHLALLSNLTVSGMSRADVDGDDTLSVMDATHIQRYLAKLIPSL